MLKNFLAETAEHGRIARICRSVQIILRNFISCATGIHRVGKRYVTRAFIKRKYDKIVHSAGARLLIRIAETFNLFRVRQNGCTCNAGKNIRSKFCGNRIILYMNLVYSRRHIVNSDVPARFIKVERLNVPFMRKGILQKIIIRFYSVVHLHFTARNVPVFVLHVRRVTRLADKQKLLKIQFVHSVQFKHICIRKARFFIGRLNF